MRLVVIRDTFKAYKVERADVDSDWRAWIPDPVNDQIVCESIGGAVNAVAQELTEIAATAAQPEMNCTPENFRQFTEDQNVTAHVQNLREVLALMKALDSGTEHGRSEIAA